MVFDLDVMLSADAAEKGAVDHRHRTIDAANARRIAIDMTCARCGVVDAATRAAIDNTLDQIADTEAAEATVAGPNDACVAASILEQIPFLQQLPIDAHRMRRAEARFDAERRLGALVEPARTTAAAITWDGCTARLVVARELLAEDRHAVIVRVARDARNR
jgi:hypothetical protein